MISLGTVFQGGGIIHVRVSYRDENWAEIMSVDLEPDPYVDAGSGPPPPPPPPPPPNDDTIAFVALPGGNLSPSDTYSFDVSYSALGDRRIQTMMWDENWNQLGTSPWYTVPAGQSTLTTVISLGTVFQGGGIIHVRVSYRDENWAEIMSVDLDPDPYVDAGSGPPPPPPPPPNPGSKPRVIITTDMHENSDADDEQSLLHLLHYADELDIVAICPDAQASAASVINPIINAYESDYYNSNYDFQSKGYPTPNEIRNKVKWDWNSARNAIINAANDGDPRPLYVCVWGKPIIVGQALQQDGSIAPKLRLLTIATDLLDKHSGVLSYSVNGNGSQRNWNYSPEADYIYNTFPNIWWVEMDWTYTLMFPGLNDNAATHGNPRQFVHDLNPYGAMGPKYWDVIYEPAHPNWDYYFRAGDTPSVLYLLDSANDDNPNELGWAGQYTNQNSGRPNYYTGISGGHNWNYDDPSSTWGNAQSVFTARRNTGLSKRKEMYDSFIAKLDDLYNR